MKIIRFMTAGSVDDGKSTLIGRLFYDSGNIYEDHLSNISKNGLNLAHFTDGLKEEREKGITIDVAYRYFESPTHKFIVADAPGHKEFTRNMVTALTHSDAVLILVDASREITEQTRRHLFLATWMEVKNIAILVNKMDLISFEQEKFYNLKSLLSVNNLITFIPISALCGDNVINSSEKMNWYNGITVNQWLHSIELDKPDECEEKNAEFSVQIAKGSQILGIVQKGVINKFSNLLINGEQECQIQNIWDWPYIKNKAYQGQSVRLEVNKEVKRGDVLIHPLRAINKLKELNVEWCYLLDNEAKFSGNFLFKVGPVEIKIKKLFPAKKYIIEDGVWVEEINEFMTMNTIYRGIINLESEFLLISKKWFAIVDLSTSRTIAAGKIII